jgi:hypothetical protein
MLPPGKQGQSLFFLNRSRKEGLSLFLRGVR